MSDLKEFKLSSKIIYRGRFLDVRKDGVRLPNGKITTREWIQHPGAACMVPILPDGQLALIRQYRYPVLQEMIELPAGKLDPGESPEECAKRELEEEIGYKTSKLTYLTHIHPAIGFASEKMWLYLADYEQDNAIKVSRTWWAMKARCIIAQVRWSTMNNYF